MRDTTFIGVTGSAGKTTTKFMIGAVLATHQKGGFTPGTHNNTRSAARSLLRKARKGDDFHVVELSAGKRGALDHQLALIRPRIGVVTNIGTDHYAAYGSIEAIAAEKGKLPRSLPADGVAVLNADDARVMAMRDTCACRVITFGTGPDAMVRAHNVTAAWPDRLAFDVSYEGQRVRVETQLCGTLWVSAALASIATGVALGIPLEAAANALASIEPNPGRMSPVLLPDGVSVIRDDWKASVHSIAPALEVLRGARAKRKVAVIGTISDTMGDAGRTYVSVARQALEVADLVCFAGPRAFAAMRAKPPGVDASRLHAFGTVRAAKEFLDRRLEPGDLVLIKGSNPADHLYRVVLARTMTVACWKTACGRQGYCDRCELVSTTSGEPSVTAQPVTLHDSDAAGGSVDVLSDATAPVMLIGLGNPGDHRANTAHNIGFAVLDRLAAAHGATWQSEPEADIGRLEWDGHPVWLIKPRAPINHSGTALHALSRRLEFGPEHCILVYDDLNLPLGMTRARMRGSDGGHRGVRSILEAFQTDQFRRVKLGVKGRSTSARGGVLAQFTPEEQAIMNAAVDTACKQLVELVRQHARARSCPSLNRTSCPAVPGPREEPLP